MINLKQKIQMYCSFCRRGKSYAIKNTEECGSKRRSNKDETKEPFWKQRYKIALYGFVVYFLLNAHRVNMSVGIVAMVNISDNENHTRMQNFNASKENSTDILLDQSLVQYDWSPKIQGYILGAGFLGYLLSLMLGGILAESIGSSLTLFIGTFISSISTMISPFTAIVHPYFLIFVQLIRGIAQGFVLPSMTVISANWFPSSERGLLFALSISGYHFGTLLGGILSSIICNSLALGGWPAVFYIFGGFGIFVSLMQTVFVRSLPKDDKTISKAELKYILENQENKLRAKRPAVPWGKIFCDVPTYALFIGLFGQYWMCVYFLALHAIFLATILQYSISQVGTLISMPQLLTLFVGVAAGILSSKAEKLISVSKVRKLCNLAGSVISSLCFALLIFRSSDYTAIVISSVFGASCIGFTTSGIGIVALDMTPTFAGSLMGVSTTFGSLAGFILPVVCGFLTNEEQTIQQWNKLLIINIVITMGSAIIFCLFGSAEIRSYNSPPEDLFPETEGEKRNKSKSVELEAASDFSNHI